ncbi:hypothetical protein LOC71_23635 [Rhodopirellula sp. JC740]|uniref:Uncharacterized protein n=1 Tax=Rhodopirellula halodulae TaxID=2894198 RepID=A0ABS8NNW3_9BACT|nr:hypothetical protein [Rhodopirellula sp. JC740]MCC9645282.1 hypothetical protein [Rhodopirellula sp. JC740]
MMMFVFSGFASLLIALELFLGVAMLGWSADKMIVEREKTPGPYWFAIVLHTLVGIGLPVLFVIYGDQL